MKSRILVIEDDVQISGLITTVLEAEGFETLTARRGAEGLDLAAATQPSLIVLDVNLPDGNGLHYCHQLRQRISTASIPVIILTAAADRSAKLAGFELGADDYITKPFDIEEFVFRVRTQLRHVEQGLQSELTGLPGNRQIERAIQSLVTKAQTEWAILYVDIDHFKSYNDVYGFLAGNEVITGAARLLGDVLREAGGSSELDFLGHIGGDDFVVITEAAAGERLARTMCRRWDEVAPSFYPAEAQHVGYIVAKNRQGVEQRFPFVSLSVGVVTNVHRPIPSVETVGNLAAEVKRKAKAQPGSSYCIDRRGVTQSPAVVGAE